VSGSFTVAQGACVHVEAGAANTNSYSVAVGVLMHGVDTGKGENAKGAVSPMVISNAMLYNGLLTNMIAQARTDLGATVDGQFLIMK
jgi:sirohydrochlorin ferrochelatase